MFENFAPSRGKIDLLCVLNPEPGDSLPPQMLDFELVVSSARSRGLVVKTVGYFDRAQEPADLETALEQWQPVCIYWHIPGRQAWERVLQSEVALAGASAPPAVVVAGGGFATHHDAALLKAAPFLDGVIRGEPEETLGAVVEGVREGRPLRDEPGLTLAVDGRTIRTDPRPLPLDLDALTARTEDFFRSERIESEHRILLSRGCSSNCQYCGLQTFYRKEFPGQAPSYWRARTAASVLDELERFHRLGVRRFILNSYVFFGEDEAGTELVREIAQGILDRHLEVEYRFVTRSVDLHRNLHLLPLLKRAGLGQLTLGLDSGLERALELYQVESSRQIALECLEALAEYQIPFHTSYIFYDPYSTLAEVRENLRFLVTLAPYYRHMAVPFSYFLDQQLLSSTLQVKWSTPLLERLKRDGLAEDVDTLSRDPRIGFRDQRVGSLFQAHQAVNKMFFPVLRALFFNIEVVKQFPAMERFPSDLMEDLIVCYEESPTCSPQDAVRRIAGWIHNQVSQTWRDMTALLRLDAEQRSRMERFFEDLASQAKAE